MKTHHTFGVTLSELESYRPSRGKLPPERKDSVAAGSGQSSEEKTRFRSYVRDDVDQAANSNCLLKARVTIFDTILLEMTVPPVDAVLVEVGETAVMEVTVTREVWNLETLATCDGKMPCNPDVPANLLGQTNRGMTLSCLCGQCVGSERHSGQTTDSRKCTKQTTSNQPIRCPLLKNWLDERATPLGSSGKRSEPTLLRKKQRGSPTSPLRKHGRMRLSHLAHFAAELKLVELSTVHSVLHPRKIGFSSHFDNSLHLVHLDKHYVRTLNKKT